MLRIKQFITEFMLTRSYRGNGFQSQGEGSFGCSRAEFQGFNFSRNSTGERIGLTLLGLGLQMMFECKRDSGISGIPKIVAGVDGYASFMPRFSINIDKMFALHGYIEGVGRNEGAGRNTYKKRNILER